MKNKIASKILAFGIAGIMLATNVMCFPMTAQAYSRCADTWIGQLDTAKTEVNITSPLLSEQGQDIYINKSENSYQIPIFLETDAVTQWEMQVVSNHPDFLEVILTDPQNSEEEVGENVPAKYLNAYIKYPEEKEETEETEEIAETEGSTESTETEGDTTVEEGDTTIEGDITVEEIDTTIEIDIPTEEITMSEVEVITVGTAMTEEGGPPTEGDDTITEGDGTITEGDDTTTEGDDTATEGDDTTTEGDDTTIEGDDTITEDDDTPTEGDDTTIEDNTPTEPVVIPEYVSAEITLTCGNKTLKGTFFFPMRITEEEMVYTGDLLTCPSIYNMETGISLANGDVATEVYYNGGIFPAMTTYTLNNTQKVVLYDGGTMKIPANAEVQLDISQTELNVQTQTAGAETAATSMDIELTTATKNYVLSYMSEPRFKDTNAPYILSEKGMTLPVTYKLGDLEPTVFLEHLTIEDNKLMWEPAEGLSYGESEDGTFQFTAEGALAGTYRVTIFWNDNNMPVHILKTAFFIQYERLDQGGTK